jgi:hypothetical protein
MSELGKINRAEVPSSLVEAIEQELSMGHQAWDMLDPREIIAAVMNAAFRRNQEAAFDVCPKCGYKVEITKVVL